MTAESTLPSPAGQPRDLGLPPAVPPVVPVPSAVGPRARELWFPALRRPVRSVPSAPLLAADTVAALAGALVLTGVRSGPLPAASLSAVLLVAGTLPTRPRPARALPGVLDDLPALCGRTAVLWLALAALLAAYDPQLALPARTLLLGWALHTATAGAGRAVVHGVRRAVLLRRPGTALVIGPAAAAQRVAAAVLRQPRYGVRPVGVVAERPGGGTGAGGLPVLTTGTEVQRALIQNGVDTVLTVGPAVRTERGALLRALAESGCTVWELDADGTAGGGPSSRGMTPAVRGTRDQFAGFPCRLLAPAAGARRPGGARGTGGAGGVGKRVLDVVVSGTLLLLLGPVLLVCATVLRCTDGPGVVFRQERVGKDGRPFTLLKFRTHRPADAHESATRWSVAGEYRMSPFCRFLRRTSLDELLQLWNVFRGEMSLVGPRPERPYFVARFSQAHPGYADRHRMPTGITGLAQIHGLRGDTSIEDRARFDNAYIDNWSLWQDICILLRTAAALVRSAGS
ncbi:sugar transferase [Streptomyces sp. NPDC047000]|uniref:sugar transferase n=1 Tax=Streptomyces sp. NPDC047000 TaxID=3155474 RepID=UPI0033F59156